MFSIGLVNVTGGCKEKIKITQIGGQQKILQYNQFNLHTHNECIKRTCALIVANVLDSY